ncbi:MAG: FkbM family methyltransferase [archaeon]
MEKTDSLLKHLAEFEIETRIGKAKFVNTCFGTLNLWELFSGEFCRDVSLRRKDAIVLDVGANWGLYSIKVAVANPQAEIYAFEPVGFLYSKLKKNIEISGAKNIRPFELGLGDFKGKAKIRDDGSILSKGAVIETVKIDLLDNFVLKNRINRVDYVKVDIEGAEYKFLLGAKRSLKKWKPSLSIELHPWNCKNVDVKISKLLRTLGYEHVWVPKEDKRLLRAEPN